MDIARVLAQLRAELENIDAAIASLERLQHGGRRRGRPPGWLAQTEEKVARAAQSRGRRAAQEKAGKNPA